MDQLTRIASALERIADALEKREPDFHSGGVVGLREDEIPAILSRGYDVNGQDVSEWVDSNPLSGIDYCMMGDDKTAETCLAKFDGMANFGKCPDDRYLTKEEAHALNRAVKRSTIKVHEGKLEK